MFHSIDPWDFYWENLMMYGIYFARKIMEKKSGNFLVGQSW